MAHPPMGFGAGAGKNRCVQQSGQMPISRGMRRKKVRGAINLETSGARLTRCQQYQNPGEHGVFRAGSGPPSSFLPASSSLSALVGVLVLLLSPSSARQTPPQLDRTLEVQGFEDQQARSWARAVEGVLPVMSCVCDPTRRPCSIAQCPRQRHRRRQPSYTTRWG